MPLPARAVSLRSRTSVTLVANRFHNHSRCAGCQALADKRAEPPGPEKAVCPCRGGLRFVFYGRVSTEDHQDPVTSLARQQHKAATLVAGHGKIVAEFFDVRQSRTLAWARRPQAAAPVAGLAVPDRGWDTIMIGEYKRAFYFDAVFTAIGVRPGDSFRVSRYHPSSSVWRPSRPAQVLCPGCRPGRRMAARGRGAVSRTRNRPSRRLFQTTKTEERVIAAEATMGLRKPSAASGRAARL